MSGIKGIVLHWTAGGNRVTEHDKLRYHFIIGLDQFGRPYLSEGGLPPENNISIGGKIAFHQISKDSPKSAAYMAHTKGFNTGRIGVSLAGMMAAVEKPFKAGSAPISMIQVDFAAKFCASLNKKYGIILTGNSNVTHAEVQPKFNIAQNGKWDIAWLPDMDRPADPIMVGDRIRAMISKYM